VVIPFSVLMCLSLVGLGVFFYMDGHKCSNNATMQADVYEKEEKSISKKIFKFLTLLEILTTLNGKFLQGAPPIEVYRASIENEVCWPAFATEKGSS